MANVKRTVELLVLGSLAGQPEHAYKLRRSIESKIGHLQKISDGMLYPLLGELETKGFIKGSVQSGVSAPDRKVFGLRKRGKSRLAELLDSPLECSGFDDKMDFLARYSLFSMLSNGQRRRILTARLEACDRSLDLLSRSADTSAADRFQLELIGRLVAAIDDECRWLMAKIKEF